MMRADKAVVSWESDKNYWVVRMQSGEEVIKRPCPKTPHDADNDTLHTLALETAKDEGYELDDQDVVVQR